MFEEVDQFFRPRVISEYGLLAEKNIKDSCYHCSAKDVMFSPEVIAFDMCETDQYSGRGIDEINFYVTYKCLICQMLNVRRFISRSTNQRYYKHQDTYPNIEHSIKGKLFNYVPSTILDAYRDALKCNVRDGKAVLLGRVIDITLCHLGVVALGRSDSLYNRIDRVKDKFGGDIPEYIKKAAQNIRIFRNWGAHYDPNNIEMVEDSDIDKCVGFVDSFLFATIEVPDMVKSSSDRIKEARDKR